MGIHDRIDPYSRVIQITDISQGAVVQDVYTSDDASSVASEQPIIRPPRRSRNVKADGIDLQSLANRLHCRSRRFAKRNNHLSFVKALVGLEEAEIENDFDWTPDNYGRSVFTSLFTQTDKMKTWNEFIEMSEEQQLAAIDYRPTLRNDDHNEQLSKGFVNVTVSEQGIVQEEDNFKHDKRNVHPCYSSEQCFKQINHNIKDLLKKRHVPLGLLENIEREIRAHFTESPYAAYERTMDTSFGRMLIHAITQYLGLESVSYECDGIRSLTVVNKNQLFSPPTLLLYQYMEWKSGNKRNLIG